MSRALPRPPYHQILADFVAFGAQLLRESIGERYRGLVPVGTRLLEPGYIPPDHEAKVLIISYYPNSSDIDKPGTPGYERVRGHLEAWRRSGAVNDYRAAYEDWVSYLDRIPFHKTRTKPIMEAVGLRNEDIARLPFVKAPMPADSSPGDDMIDIDIDATWAQLQLLRPNVVWIQGVAIADRITGLVRDRITDKVLPPQSVSQYVSAKKRSEERERIARWLQEYLSVAS